MALIHSNNCKYGIVQNPLTFVSIVSVLQMIIINIIIIICLDTISPNEIKKRAYDGLQTAWLAVCA